MIVGVNKTCITMFVRDASFSTNQLTHTTDLSANGHLAYRETHVTMPSL